MANSAITALPVATNGLILLEEQSAATDPSIDFTGKITSAYDEYEIHFLNVQPANDGVQFYMRTSNDNGTSYDSGASDYIYAGLGYYVGATANYNSTGAAQLQLTSASRTIGNGAGEGYCGVLRLFSPAASSKTRVAWSGNYNGTTAAEPAVVDGTGRRDAAEAVDAVQFLMSAGNIASGTIKLYGVKDSEGATTTASAATQSEMEAGTSTTTFVSPGRSQYHPSAAKAWIKFTGEGTIAISASYNTTSITDITTGEYTWTIATDFSGADWCFQGAVESEGGAGTFGRTINIQDGEQAAGTVNVITGIAATTTVDVTTVHCAGYGDQ